MQTHGGNKMAKILVAEDEPDIRDLIAIILRIAHHEVVTVSNGVEAVECVAASTPDLILLDVRMHRMSGYEACQRIKANPATASIPVVFLSAKGQETDIHTGLALGALDYVLKPFTPDELVAKVNEILSRSE